MLDMIKQNSMWLIINDYDYKIICGMNDACDHWIINSHDYEVIEFSQTDTAIEYNWFDNYKMPTVKSYESQGSWVN